MCVVVLLREEVAQLQEEVHLLRQMKDMLSKDLEDTQGSCSADVLSATELRVQLAQKEQELDRAKEALQGRDRVRETVCVTVNINIITVIWTMMLQDIEGQDNNIISLIFSYISKSLKTGVQRSRSRFASDMT